MKRLIAFALILSLFLLLSACAPKEVNRSEVWNEVVAALGYEPYRLQYCASENGYHIMAWGGNLCDMLDVDIAGYTFSGTSDTKLVAYKDGEFTDLKAAFFLGLVSREGIARAHTAREGKQLGFTPKIYATAREYFEDEYGPLENFQVYFEENGCQIVYAVKKDAANEPITQTIADIEFHFSKKASLYVYRDGTVCGLNWAYNMGVFGKDTVAKAARLHAEYENKTE